MSRAPVPSWTKRRGGERPRRRHGQPVNRRRALTRGNAVTVTANGISYDKNWSVCDDTPTSPS
jgi:hypothetical protein